MSNRKSVFGIAVVLAMALSPFAAANASATGATAYTCVKDAPNGKFAGAHCLEGAGEYKHVAFANKTTVTGTNISTTAETTAARSATLKGTLVGLATEITCSQVHNEGTLENKTTGEEMYVHLEGITQFTECVVTAPAGKGCKVKEGKLTTNLLTATSEKQGDALKITPKELTFMSIPIEGCSISGLNNTFPVTGTIKSVRSGATWISNHAEITAQNTLKFGGNKAGIDGALTVKGHEKEGEETNPIVATK